MTRNEFYAQQPNGLWCRFSTRCNTVVEMDISISDAKDWIVSPFSAVIAAFLPTVDTVATFNAKLEKMGSLVRMEEEFFKYEE